MKEFKYIFAFICAGLFFQSCFDDLNTVPLDDDQITSANVYHDPSSYREVLAKLYAGLAVTGQQGPAGNADIQGIDEGFGQYLRGYWYHQELSTDEALVGWNDQTIKDFHAQNWSASDGFIFAFYSRVFYQISLCNEFLRETTDDKLNDRGVDANLAAEIQGFRAEARFLRALSYWHAMDLFGNPPFVTEADAVGSFFPPRIQSADLFAWLESELLAIEGTIAVAGSNEYGRADQGGVWMLLSKLYLNAERYAGLNKYEECKTYSERAINAYSMDPTYANLFLADNNTADGIIFPIAFDGVNTRTWGGTTFIIRAGIGGDMNAADSGVESGWGGTRTTKEIVQKFPMVSEGGILVQPNPGNTVNYPKIYISGTHQGWDPGNTSNAIASVNSDQVYEGYEYFPEPNGQFKIYRFPSSSAPNFGDDDNDGILDPNGAEINVPEAGLYFIHVDLNDNTYFIEKREFGILGDATPGGWDNDQDMTWNAENKSVEVILPITSGEFKFRANDDWAINLGDDDDGDGVLELDGANIQSPVTASVKVSLYLNFPDYTYSIALTNFDSRPMFYSLGSEDIADITDFVDGYAVVKFKNLTSDGNQGSDVVHADTDFPLFRVADAYLMYAEAALRLNNDLDKALTYVNDVRTRAYGDQSGNISQDDLDLDFILDERAREFYWECHRRTDLIRFGQFSDGDYLWQWKGGEFDGAQVPQHFDLYPIPQSDLTANPMLEQNDGY